MTPRRNWDRWLVLALSLASLWPFAGALLEGRVPGQKELPIDGGNGLFIFALVQDVLLGKADLLHTEAMWFPTGRPFLLVVQNVVDAVAAQPFLLLLGPAHGLAAFTAVALVANGLAAGWMGERIGGRGWSGPAAALVLALCPYIWAEAQVGRVTQTLLFPICLAVGASWTAVESGRGAARAGRPAAGNPVAASSTQTSPAARPSSIRTFVYSSNRRANWVFVSLIAAI